MSRSRSTLGPVTDASLEFATECMKHLMEETSLALLVESEIVQHDAKVTPSAPAQQGSASEPGRHRHHGSAVEPGRQPHHGSAVEPGQHAPLAAHAAAAPSGLPSAPSEFRASLARGRDVAQLIENFGRVCQLGRQQGRFAQPILLRYQDGHSVKAVGVQPCADAIWQATTLFGKGDVSGITKPQEVVDLVAGVAAKARKGDVVLLARDQAKHPHAQFQRGVDFFAKIFDDLQACSLAYTKDDGKVHPVLWVEATSGCGDSICAMAERVLSARRAGAPKNLVQGIFFDSKDAHRQVTKARRNKTVRTHYTDGRLKVDGFDPVPAPDDLRTLKEEVKKPIDATLSVLSTTERDDLHYLVIPEASTLAFQPTGKVEQRLKELRAEFPPPPPAKRPRIGACEGGSQSFPKKGTLQDLLKDFILLSSKPVTVGGQEFRMLRLERKCDRAIAFYLQNQLGTRRTIPAKSHLTSSVSGRCLNRLLPEHRALIPDTAIQWPYSLSSPS